MEQCKHCGLSHETTCPRIKSIEYHPDGAVKRVEFHPVLPVFDVTPKLGHTYIRTAPAHHSDTDW